MRGNHRLPVNFPHTGQWSGALMFSLICAWINGWVNNREAGDLRRHHAHYDVSVMWYSVESCVLFCCCKHVAKRNLVTHSTKGICLFLFCLSNIFATESLTLGEIFQINLSNDKIYHLLVWIHWIFLEIIRYITCWSRFVYGLMKNKMSKRYSYCTHCQPNVQRTTAPSAGRDQKLRTLAERSLFK